jgi:hypothetical protein
MRETARSVLVLALFAGCAASGPADRSSGGGPERGAAEREVLEAVFRYQFEHNESGLQKEAAAYCLCVPGEPGDPDGAFIERFAADRPPVRRCTACGWNEGRIVDKESGKGALTFYVSKITWYSADEAEVAGGYREGNLSASNTRYRVTRSGGRWVVQDARLQVIS